MNLRRVITQLFLVTLCSAFIAPSQLAAAEPDAVVWNTEGFEAPESAHYDSASKAIFVSNVVGSPIEKDGKGHISRLGLDGKVLTREWVKGLNAPKGLRVHNGRLWVADIDQVLAIDVKTAKIVSRTAVPDARFLNDLEVAADGTVYVSDTLRSNIVQLRLGKVSTLLESDKLESPNGLLIDNGRLVIGAWGLTTDFTTKVPGRLLAIDLATKKLSPISLQPVGNLDGVEPDGSGGYFVSDWNAGTVMHLPARGRQKLLIEGLKGAADLGIVPGRQLLIVPRMNENLVTAYDLKKLGK
jgi:sugar lactone lactonase YvrE